MNAPLPRSGAPACAGASRGHGATQTVPLWDKLPRKVRAALAPFPDQ
jgi:hypothetical protein